jgi:hypothetical protein
MFFISSAKAGLAMVLRAFCLTAELFLFNLKLFVCFFSSTFFSPSNLGNHYFSNSILAAIKSA